MFGYIADWLAASKSFRPMHGTIELILSAFVTLQRDKLMSEQKNKQSSLLESQKNLSKDAYNDIRRMIFLDKFRPGQKVAYRKMAERLEMSLTPVVQALKLMEHMGIVRHEPNRGFFIEKITAQEVEEAYGLREMIELNLLPTVIRKLDSNGEKELTQALDEYFKASRNKPVKVRLAKDINFHMTMAKLSGQHISIWILRYLYDILYLRFDRELVFYRPHDKSGQEHQAIFDAVIARDLAAARKALRQHIRNICSDTLDQMQNMVVDIDDVDF